MRVMPMVETEAGDGGANIVNVLVGRNGCPTSRTGALKLQGSQPVMDNLVK